MMGVARVTEREAGSLSNVTVRGVESVLTSAELFKKENTALTPSASRNAVAGLKPFAVSNSIFGNWLAAAAPVPEPESVGFDSPEIGPPFKLFPKARC